jgi:hypothetical protein
MFAHEDSPSSSDELARRRQERASGVEVPLRERVRDEARRNKRRHAAADRARRRAGDGQGAPPPHEPPFGGGDTAGAA